MRLFEFESVDMNKLDDHLAKLCSMVKKQEGKQYPGMVAACIITPKGKIVAKNSSYHDGKWRHAERNAIDEYTQYYGMIPEGSIMVTTLSPCNEKHDETAKERHGMSCTDLINHHGFKYVYCGYKDPTQEDDHGDYKEVVTKNKQLRDMCGSFADSFLEEGIISPAVVSKIVSKVAPAVASKVAPEAESGLAQLLKKMNYQFFGRGGGEWIMTFKNTQLEFNSAGVFYNGPPVKGPNGVKPNFGIKWRHDPEWYSPRGEISFEHAWKMGLFPNIQGMYPLLKSMDQGGTNPETVKKINQLMIQSAKNHLSGQNIVKENFADGRQPEDKGDSKKYHVPTKSSISNLRKFAKNHSGRAAQLAHWMANMKSGHKK
jgi:pyrimidine deaminase RibD-like protein